MFLAFLVSSRCYQNRALTAKVNFLCENVQESHAIKVLSWPLFLYFRLFYCKENFCRCRDSNRGDLVSEATTLPTVPQPLSKLLGNMKWAMTRQISKTCKYLLVPATQWCSCFATSRGTGWSASTTSSLRPSTASTTTCPSQTSPSSIPPPTSSSCRSGSSWRVSSTRLVIWGLRGTHRLFFNKWWGSVDWWWLEQQNISPSFRSRKEKSFIYSCMTSKESKNPPIIMTTSQYGSRACFIVSYHYI